MSDGTPPGRFRRQLLRGAALSGSLALSGCLSGLSDDSSDDASTDTSDDGTGAGTPGGSSDADGGGPDFPEIENRPDAVYRPTHREAMRVLEPVSAGDYGIAPMVTYPHRFWTVSGRTTSAAEPTAEDDVHLMVTAWDRETGMVVPVDAGVRFEIHRDGDLVTDPVPWLMLSQLMGFHYGDNVPLGEDGTYRVEGRIGAVSARKTGAFAGRFDSPVTFEFEFEYDQTVRDLVLEVEYFDEDRWGEPGALEPMGHGDVPYSSSPPAEELPGTLQGTPTTGDAVLATTLLEPGSRFVDGDERYLAVSPRTPYNRCVLPLVTIEGAVDGDAGTETVDPEETIDDELGYHYGAPLESVADGDELTLEVVAPPQVERHQGYETAFLEMPPVRLTLSP